MPSWPSASRDFRSAAAQRVSCRHDAALPRIPLTPATLGPCPDECPAAGGSPAPSGPRRARRPEGAGRDLGLSSTRWRCLRRCANRYRRARSLDGWRCTRSFGAASALSGLRGCAWPALLRGNLPHLPRNAGSSVARGAAALRGHKGGAVVGRGNPSKPPWRGHDAPVQSFLTKASLPLRELRSCYTVRKWG